MYPCFDIDEIWSERLLEAWKGLAPGEFRLPAVNRCGGLFLQDIHGSVPRLDVTGGTISSVADSTAEFQQAARNAAQKRDRFLEELAEQADSRREVSAEC
jgi:hypothetical protein